MNAKYSMVTMALGLLLAAQVSADGGVAGRFSEMMTQTDTTTARVSSFDRTGANLDFKGIAPGETLELANLDGTGIVRHLYFSIWGGEHYLRDLVLRAYWDGQETPCVEVPFGDFFGLGHERPRFYTSLMITVNPGDLGVFGTFGFNSYFPMPYAKGARLTLANEGSEVVPAVWYQIEYEKMDALPPNSGRFHATWHRANPTKAVGEVINQTLHEGINDTGKDNYVLLDAEGHGALAGIFLNIDNAIGNWYGEGDDMIFIDGEPWPPSLHGTGTEDYFSGAYCPHQEFHTPYAGITQYSGSPTWTEHDWPFRGKNSMYRFHIEDPIRFEKSIRVTIEHGHNNKLTNDYSSTAYWYQFEPHGRFPKLPPVKKRLVRPDWPPFEAGEGVEPGPPTG
jgi:hypothetical protein